MGPSWPAGSRHPCPPRCGRSARPGNGGATTWPASAATVPLSLRRCDTREVGLRRLQRAPLAAVCHVTEKLAKPRDVRTVAPLVEPGAHEPAVGPRGGL